MVNAVEINDKFSITQYCSQLLQLAEGMQARLSTLDNPHDIIYTGSIWLFSMEFILYRKCELDDMDSKGSIKHFLQSRKDNIMVWQQLPVIYNLSMKICPEMEHYIMWM